MVMGLFKGSRDFDINDLIVNKKYTQAAELISKALGANNNL